MNLTRAIALSLLCGCGAGTTTPTPPEPTPPEPTPPEPTPPEPAPPEPAPPAPRPPVPTGWAPLGRSELAPWGSPRTWSWRDAAVGGPWSAFDTAVDRAGRVLVATMDEHLALQVWREVPGAEAGLRWELLPELPLPEPEGAADGTWQELALTTDGAGEPLVFWLYGAYAPTPGQIGWARHTAGRWDVHDTPPPPSDDVSRLGIVATPRGVRLYAYDQDWTQGDSVVYELALPPVPEEPVEWARHAVPHTRLVVTPSVAGRLAWAAVDAESHVTWSGPDAIPDPPAEVRAREPEGVGGGCADTAPLAHEAWGEPFLVDAAAGWRWVAARSDRDDALAVGSGSAEPILVEGYDHLVGTHYETEVNRFEAWRRVGDAWEPLSSAPLSTALLNGMRDHVRLLPTPSPTLVLALDRLSVLRWNGHEWWGLDGEPEPAGDLGDPAHVASRVQFLGDELRWRELTEAGDVLRSARWDGTQWSSEATTQLPGSAWMWGQDSGRTHLLMRIGGTWDRLLGLMGETPEPALFRWTGQAREDIPLPIPTVGAECGEPGRTGCVPTSILERPDGSVLAVLEPKVRPPDPPGELQRYTSGAWKREALLDARPADTPALHGGDPASAWLDDGVLIETDGAWLPAPLPAKFERVDALGIEGGHVLAVGLEKESRDDPTGTLRLVEYDGTAWNERAGLPTDPAEGAALAQGPDGAVWLATVMAGEVRLLRRTDAGWVGLGGSDGPRGVSDSPAESYGPAIGFVDRRVCVAWIEAADQEPTVNVRCHAWGT